MTVCVIIGVSMLVLGGVTFGWAVCMIRQINKEERREQG